MTQPSKNGENAVDMLAVARIAQGVDIAGFAGPDAVKLVAPAKVNLFLDIGAKRADGYHEAVSIMHALMLHDVLRMKLAPGRGEGLSVDLSCVAREGLAMLDVPVESNIVAKAVRLLAEKLGRTADETVVACLEKHIPAEAGLGGGSSDAAAALLGAAHLWGVPADDPRIEEAARSLGADVAFFLHGGCACFTGVGDAFDHALAPMNGNVVLVKPEGGVSTAAAYRAFDEHPTAISEADRGVAPISKPSAPPTCRCATTSCPFPSTCFRRSWTSACGLASASTCSACSCRAAGRPCSCSAPRSPMQVAWPPRRACAAGGRVLPCLARRVRPWCRTAEISAARCIREI